MLHLPQGRLRGGTLFGERLHALLQGAQLFGQGRVLGLQWRKLCSDQLSALENMTLWGELLQVLQVFAGGLQRCPTELGLRLLTLGVLNLPLQAGLFDEPGVLLLQLTLLGLAAFVAPMRLVQVVVQRPACLGVERQRVAGAVGQRTVRLAGLPSAGERALAQLRVDRSVRQLFQQLAAFAVIGLQERTELALRQHHGAGELLEIQPQARFDLLFVLLLAAGQQLLGVQVVQALPALLQLAAGFVARTVGVPAGAVALAVDADEIDLGVARTAAPTQQVARVVGGDVALGVRHLGLAAHAVQARHAAEQGQAQSIEQGALTGARRAGDGKQACTGQGFGSEVDVHRPGQGGQVLQANGEDFHGCSCACCTSCNNKPKSASACSSTTAPYALSQALANRSCGVSWLSSR